MQPNMNNEIQFRISDILVDLDYKMRRKEFLQNQNTIRALRQKLADNKSRADEFAIRERAPMLPKNLAHVPYSQYRSILQREFVGFSVPRLEVQTSLDGRLGFSQQDLVEVSAIPTKKQKTTKEDGLRSDISGLQVQIVHLRTLGTQLRVQLENQRQLHDKNAQKLAQMRRQMHQSEQVIFAYELVRSHARDARRFTDGVIQSHGQFELDVDILQKWLRFDELIID